MTSPLQSSTHLYPHGIYVDLLIQVVQQRNSLNHHRVDFVRRKLQLEPTHRMTETEGHGVQIFRIHTAE